jgi:ABC-2 type transport system permease protein
MNVFSKIANTALYKVIDREIKRFLDSRVMPFITLAAPLIAFLLILGIFSAGVIRKQPVIVVDNDNTSLSRMVSRAIDATPAASVTRINSISDARERMNTGKCEAIVVIDRDFEKEVFKGTFKGIPVYINNTNSVLGGSLKSAIYRSLTTLSTGIKVQFYMKKGASMEQAKDKALPVMLNSHILFNPYANYSYFLVLALLPLMINVVTFLGTTYALGIELKEGTAGEWLRLADNNIYTALAGKLIPYTLLFMINVMVMNIIIFVVLGTPIRGSLLLILVSEIVFVIAYQFLAILFLVLTSNLRLSLSFGSAYTMMALSFSGLTFPTMSMPLVAKIFSCIFPYTFWLKVFLSQTIQGEPVSNVFTSFLILFVYIVICLFAFRGMKKRCSDSKYWGRT